EIPTYFFTGGMAGGAALLTLGARLAGNDVLARRALAVNTAAIAVSPVLLIKDLGRPKRFYNMLRVFKVTSPMSVGTWILSASGGGAVAALRPAAAAGPARRLAIVGGALELAATKAMEDRLGDLVGEPYRTGLGGTASKGAKAATAAGAALMALAGRRRVGAVAAGALLCTGALLERFAVYHAGKASALDPRYTSVPQRDRIERIDRSFQT